MTANWTLLERFSPQIWGARLSAASFNINKHHQLGSSPLQRPLTGGQASLAETHHRSVFETTTPLPANFGEFCSKALITIPVHLVDHNNCPRSTSQAVTTLGCPQDEMLKIALNCNWGGELWRHQEIATQQRGKRGPGPEMVLLLRHLYRGQEKRPTISQTIIQTEPPSR